MQREEQKKIDPRKGSVFKKAYQKLPFLSVLVFMRRLSCNELACMKLISFPSSQFPISHIGQLTLLSHKSPYRPRSGDESSHISVFGLAREKTLPIKRFCFPCRALSLIFTHDVSSATRFFSFLIKSERRKLRGIPFFQSFRSQFLFLIVHLRLIQQVLSTISFPIFPAESSTIQR